MRGQDILYISRSEESIDELAVSGKEPIDKRQLYVYGVQFQQFHGYVGKTGSEIESSAGALRLSARHPE